MIEFSARIAAAPVSWGICEVPGWGYQLPAGQALAGMARIGVTSSELGPDEFVPGSAAAKRQQFAEAGIQCIGAFCPVKLHDPDVDVRSLVERVLATFEALGASVMVLAADTGNVGYDQRDVLDDSDWATLLKNVAFVRDLAADRGVTACLHPHIGTMIETESEVRRFLSESTVPICLDAGHLLVGGTDPVALAQAFPDRVAHVHLKDVDLEVLATVKSGQRTYSEGVANGMYKVLGQGDIDLPAIIQALESAGYQGWYVPEHDRMLPSASAVTTAQSDAEASVSYLRQLQIS